MTKPTADDAAHLALVNQLIGAMNTLLAAGYARDFVASAAVAAAAAFTGFNLSDGGGRPVSDAELERVGAQFAVRVRDFLNERWPARR